MIHRTLIKSVFILTMGLLTSLQASFREEIHEKTVKVYIWGENQAEKIGSHVALQTNQSYISLRPDVQAEEAVSMDTPEGLKMFLKAPLLCVNSFEDDCRLQGNKAPDRSYRIKVNPSSKAIDKEWQKLLKARAMEDDGKSPLQGLKRLDGLWSAICGPDFDALLSQEEMISNSSAIVLYALAHGQLPMNDLLADKIASRKVAATSSALIMSQLRGQLDTEKFFSLFNQFGGAKFCFMPCDVEEVVKKRIKARVLAKLTTKVKNQRLVVRTQAVEGKPTQNMDPNQVVSFVGAHFPVLLNDKTAFRDCLTSFGIWIWENGVFTVTLSEQTLRDIQQHATQNRGWFWWVPGSCSVQ
jgi:hypothetical protein